MQTAESPPLLRRIHATLVALEALLQREADSLGRNDLDALATITPEKLTLCRELEALERELKATGDATTWRRLSLWADIARLFQTCQRHNRRNGMVVVRKRHDVATLLATLHGQNGAERATYDRSGDTRHTGGGGDLLASA